MYECVYVCMYVALTDSIRYTAEWHAVIERFQRLLSSIPSTIGWAYNRTHLVCLLAFL